MIINYTGAVNKDALSDWPQVDKTPRIPLDAWTVGELKFQSKKYYLFVEPTTGLAILTQTLDPAEFFRNLAYWVRFLVGSPTLTEEYVANLSSSPVVVQKAQQLDFRLAQAKQFIRQEADKVMEMSADLEVIDGQIRELYTLQFMLVKMFGDEDVIYELDRHYGVAPQAPKGHPQYANLAHSFKDPRLWQKHLGQWLDEVAPQVLDGFDDNDQKMEDEFVDYAAKQWVAEDLAREVIQAAQTSDGDRLEAITQSESRFARAYYWLTNGMGHDKETMRTIKILIDFLIHTGTIRQSDGKKIKADLDRYTPINDPNVVNRTLLPAGQGPAKVDLIAVMKMALKSGNLSAGELTATKKLLQFMLDHPGLADQLYTDEPMSPEVAKELDRLLQRATEAKLAGGKTIMEPTAGPTTYTIRAELIGYQPATWRRFVISGAINLDELAQAVMLMFNANFSHLYGVENPQRKESYASDPERQMGMGLNHNDDWASNHTLSELVEDDQLVVNYDFGDSWGFELTIQKIERGKQVSAPEVLAAKGLGIIDDIGGVWGLSEYAEAYRAKDKQALADYKDWMGKLIDPDKVDVKAINKELKQFGR